MPACWTYTSEELLGLRRYDVRPTRPARKTIFSHGIWLPRRARIARRLRESKQQVAVEKTPVAVESTNRPTARFGLLNAGSIGNKTVKIASLIGENAYDVFLITETWHTASEDVALRRCIPDGYFCIDQPRHLNNIAKTNHGGVAAIVSDRYRCKRLVPPSSVTSFESVCFSISGSGSTIVVLLLYRPGSVGVTDRFYAELTQYLEVLSLYKCQIIIAGDFNVDVNANRFAELVESFDCIQHVPAVRTHRDGGTLDLVITKSGQVITGLVVGLPGIISDHSVISWQVPFDQQTPITQYREIRGWSKLDANGFRSALVRSELCDVTKRPSSADEYFGLYHSVLQRLADQFAPINMIALRRQRLAVWMDAECRLLRRTSRMLERRYRRSGQPSDRLEWIKHEHERHRIYRQKEQTYWCARLSDNAGQPRKLWQSLNNILGRNGTKTTGNDRPTAQQLLDYFNEKVASVRNSTGGLEPTTILPSAEVHLDIFEECSSDDVQRVIIGGPSKHCALDPMPTTIVKMFLPELLPYVTDMCNISLRQGCLPETQRHAIVTPRLKKANADPADVKSYRPISNLTFMSKTVERLVCRQLVAYLNRHDLLPRFQSAYRKYHSTETNVLKLACDALLAADRGEVTFLGFLDLSAAFDTVDHSILIDRLHQTFGLRGSVLNWIKSFISKRTQTVSFDGRQSNESENNCGVPQGSVLGPVLFILYAADVIAIAERNGFRVHSYADDTQLYFHDKAETCETRLPHFSKCINEIDKWMTSNRLKMNADKTDFIWLGTRQQLAKVQGRTVDLGAVQLPVSTEVTCLGVVFDSELTFSAHVKSLVSRCFYHLRQLRTVRRSLTTDSIKTLVHALIASRLDYCNSVFFNISATNMRALQSVLNAAARLITRKRKYDHISLTLRDDLHWLPIQQRIDYKLCTLVYKCIHQTAPTYISELCVPVSSISGRRNLRSAAHGDLQIPATGTMTYGPRSFAVSGPTIWNSLPFSLRDATLTLTQFHSRLKTHLFSVAYK